MTSATAASAPSRSMPAGFPSDIPLDALSVQMLAMLERHDPAAARLFAQEAERQATTLELIASENHVSTE
ncbi:MAG: Serine hydroxymethyltransferase, partial [Planctomycetota bacterium]